MFSALVLGALSVPSVASAGDLVRGVRGKLSAGDLASGEAAVERYRAETGVDKEYLEAVGWLARGAEMLGRREKAAAWVAELRREIPAEKDDLTIALGAAIEVEGRLRVASEGRGSAIRFLEKELAAAKDPAFRSRISKNLNLLGLEGQKAPEIGAQETLGRKTRLSDLAGKPVLLFFWANWCGDCKAESPKLARLNARYGPKGLAMLAPTRFYGEVDGKAVDAATEKDAVAKVWAETYPGLPGVPVPIDTETMVRYGASATPTYALVDRKGVVRLYAPTRLSEAELSR
ncbi:MAG: TlpA family protein disulfide reductase, partial [Acidobacteria bacterium]|nr:TlpA family protein disulfide reductase [Acidobacteriota bacterium]